MLICKRMARGTSIVRRAGPSGYGLVELPWLIAAVSGRNGATRRAGAALR